MEQEDFSTAKKNDKNSNGEAMKMTSPTTSFAPFTPLCYLSVKLVVHEIKILVTIAEKQTSYVVVLL